VNSAAVFAVAHSPFAGGLSQDFDCGAIWINCASVREVSFVASEKGIGAAVEKRASERMSDVVRIECIVFSSSYDNLRVFR